MLNFIYSKTLNFENEVTRGLDFRSFTSDSEIKNSINTGLSAGNYIQVGNLFGGKTPTDDFY